MQSNIQNLAGKHPKWICISTILSQNQVTNLAGRHETLVACPLVNA